MARFAGILVISTILVLASCAGLPKAESESDSLVVGSFVLDYPDGFFDKPARTIESNIRLNFLNRSTGATFWVVTTRGGYFYFTTNGIDQFDLTSYAFTVPEKEGTYSGGGEFKYPIDVSRHCVQYVGHLTLTYAHPSMEMAGSSRMSWNFDTSYERKSRKAEMIEFLRDTDPETPWLTLEVQE